MKELHQCETIDDIIYWLKNKHRKADKGVWLYEGATYAGKAAALERAQALALAEHVRVLDMVAELLIQAQGFVKPYSLVLSKDNPPYNLYNAMTAAITKLKEAK